MGIRKDILVMSFQFIGACLFGSLAVLNNIGMTSYAVKEFSETTFSILSLVVIGFLLLFLIYCGTFWVMEKSQVEERN